MNLKLCSIFTITPERAARISVPKLIDYTKKHSSELCVPATFHSLQVCSGRKYEDETLLQLSKTMMACPPIGHWDTGFLSELFGWAIQKEFPKLDQFRKELEKRRVNAKDSQEKQFLTVILDDPDPQD